ncbi:MAG TPA: tetratricopeptide repeat protein [Polyangia bacterium]
MALAGLLVFVAGLCLVPAQETDLFFRLSSGEQFLRTGSLVHHNLFSFTFPDAPYLDSAWLFDTGAALLYRLGGFPAVVIGKTLVVLSIAALAYRTCRRQGASHLASTLALALAFLCMRERLVERPHIFSLLGDVVVLGFLPTIEKGGRRSWLLFPLVALWANLHAGAFLATILLGLASFGCYLDRAPRRVCLRFCALTILSLPALLATPVGVGIVRYLAFHVGIFDLHPVDEFRSLTWRSDAPFILFAMGALLLLGLVRRQVWLWRLPAVGLLALAAWHVRFSADATLVLAVVAAPSLTALASRFEMARPRLYEAVVLAILVVSALAPRIAEAARGSRFVAIGLDESALPLDAIRFVEMHGLRERMYNDFETGAYLLWQGYPRYHVFVDPRLPAYPVPFHRLLGRMDIPREEWSQAMEGLGVESALLDYAGINRRAAFWDPERWALVFRAKDSRVFVRRLPQWKGLIAALEIPATFDFAIETGAATRPLPTPPGLSPVPICEWQIRLGDLYFDLDSTKSDRAIAAYRLALAAPAGCLASEHELAASAWVGSTDVSAGRFEQALPLLDRALALAPEDTAVLTNRALALTGLGRRSEAREVWKTIASLAAGTDLGRRAAEKAVADR